MRAGRCPSQPGRGRRLRRLRGSSSRRRLTRAAHGSANDVDVAVHVLGHFRLALAGQAIETSNGGKRLRVLKYLLSHRDRPVPKDVLIDLFGRS
jgi:hypothetical protein